MRDTTLFAEWLRQRRRTLDFTQAELAEQVSCAPVTIRKLEYGDSFPSKDLALTLAQVLGVPADEQDAFVRFARGEQGKDDKMTGWQSGSVAALPNLPISQSLTPSLSHSLPHNLPSPTTPLVGRQAELAQLQALLVDPACRLVTITAPGGMGKTRLALEAAKTILDFRSFQDKLSILDSAPATLSNNPKSKIQNPKFSDGVFFVALASITSPDYIVPEIADAIGLRFAGQMDVQTQLFNYLREKRMLLVLDNMEQLMSGNAPGGIVAPAEASSTLLLELLQTARGLKLLATSREPLNFAGEWLVELAGLSIPTAEMSASEDASSRLDSERGERIDSDAVALFLQCARRLRPNFMPNIQELAAVGRICRLVDGLPLGIELAASWVRALSCGEIADEIEQNVAFLATNQRGMPARHRSMQAVFDHSWQLLAEEEQRVLAGLSIFRGGFTRQAAAAITGATLADLSTLIAKSLVRRSGEQRYEQHELVRQFAATKLAQQPVEQYLVQKRHSHYFLTFLTNQEETLASRHQSTVQVELHTEIDNIRRAWDWAVDQRQYRQLCDGTWSLFYFLQLQNYFQEGERVFRQALTMLQGQQTTPSDEPLLLESTKSYLSIYLSWFSFRVGQVQTGFECLCAVVAQLRQQTAQSMLPEALFFCGATSYYCGRFAEAEQCLGEAMPLYQGRRSRWFVAYNTLFLGTVLHEQSKYEDAYRWLQKSLVHSRDLGDPHAITLVTNALSQTMQTLGRYDEIRPLLNNALQLAQIDNNSVTVGFINEQLAAVAHAVGERAEAWQLLTASVTLYRQVGSNWSLVRVLNQMGDLALAQGDLTCAHDYFLEALAEAQAAKMTPRLLDALIGLTAVLSRNNNAPMALALSEIVVHHPAAAQEARDRAEYLAADLTCQLAVEQAKTARARFQGQPLEAVVAEVLRQM